MLRARNAASPVMLLEAADSEPYADGYVIEHAGVFPVELDTLDQGLRRVIANYCIDARDPWAVHTLVNALFAVRA